MRIEQIYGPHDFTNAMNAAEHTEVTSRDMAHFYADVLRAYARGHKIDWLALNTAILKRWAPSTLRKIKNAAWKDLETRARGPAKGDEDA